MLENLLNTLFLLKIGIIIVLVFYIIFSLLIVNQMRTMNRVVNLSSHNIVFYFGLLNIFLGISLFLVSLVIL